MGGQFYVMTNSLQLFRKTTSAPIKTIGKLIDVLEITEAELNRVLELKVDERYSSLIKIKSNGEQRIVFNPVNEVRRVQKRIKNRILKELVVWPDFIFGSIPKKKGRDPTDYVACAAKHTNARSVLKIDIKSFFDNIHENLVFKIYKNFFGYGDDVAKILTNISCRDGSLCQGAITSSYLASLVLYDVEPAMVAKLNRKRLVYTRYVDDITVSSRESNYDFSYVMNVIENVLNDKELPINNKKTLVLNSGSEAILVHGLRVNTVTVRLPIDEIRRIRAGVKNLELVALENGYRWSQAYRREYYKHLGRVYKLKRIGHNQSVKLIERMEKIKPKPSRYDLKVTVKMIRKIKETYGHDKSNFWFKRRYNVVVARLNFLANSKKFSYKIKLLREYVKKYKPIFSE